MNNSNKDPLKVAVEKLQKAYSALQQFKQSWQHVPCDENRMTQKTYEAIYAALSPIVNLDAVGGPLDLTTLTANPITAEGEQERFEKRIKEFFGTEDAGMESYVTRAGRVRYYTPEIENQWQGWQLRAALPANMTPAVPTMPVEPVAKIVVYTPKRRRKGVTSITTYVPADFEITDAASIIEETLLYAAPVQQKEQEAGKDADNLTLFIVARPGMAPRIGRPIGDVAASLREWYAHNPGAEIYVVNSWSSSVGCQTVENGREVLFFADAAEQADAQQSNAEAAQAVKDHIDSLTVYSEDAQQSKEGGAE